MAEFYSDRAYHNGANNNNNNNTVEFVARRNATMCSCRSESRKRVAEEKRISGFSPERNQSLFSRFDRRLFLLLIELRIHHIHTLLYNYCNSVYCHAKLLCTISVAVFKFWDVMFAQRNRYQYRLKTNFGKILMKKIKNGKSHVTYIIVLNNILLLFLCSVVVCIAPATPFSLHYYALGSHANLHWFRRSVWLVSVQSRLMVSRQHTVFFFTSPAAPLHRSVPLGTTHRRATIIWNHYAY